MSDGTSGVIRMSLQQLMYLVLYKFLSPFVSVAFVGLFWKLGAVSWSYCPGHDPALDVQTDIPNPNILSH